MKKFLLLLLPIALMPSITACQDKAHSIVAINTADKTYKYVDITSLQFERLMDQKQSFFIEFYGNACSHCKNLEPLLEQYVQSTGNLIYRYDLWSIEQDTYYSEVEKYPGVMPDGVPTMKFIKNGEATYEVDSSKHSSYTALSNILNKHFLKSGISMASTYNGFLNFRQDNENSKYIAFVYDLNNNKSIEMAAKYLITENLANTKKKVLLLNYQALSDDFSNIKNYYNVTANDTFAVFVENGAVTKTIDYATDGDSLADWVSNL